MNSPSAHELQVYLSQTDLSQVAISARLDDQGKLHPIEGLFLKLTAAARSGLKVGVPRIVILSDQQKDIPSEFRRDDSMVTILQAPTLAEAIERLAREQGAYLAVRRHELHQHDRWDTLDPTVNRSDYFERHYQELPLLLARKAGTSAETSESSQRFIDLLAWEAQVRQRPESYDSLTLAQALAHFRTEPAKEGDKEAEKKPDRPVRMAVIGQPGSGKTMLEHYLAHRVAETKLGQPSLFARLLLPVRVRLRDWKRWSEEHYQFGLPAYLEHHYGALGLSPRPSLEQFQHWLNRGDVLILYDGLDEIDDIGDFLSQGLKAALGNYPRSPVVLSCRTPTFEIYRGLCYDFDVYLLGPLSEEQRNAYIERYPFASGFDRQALIARLDSSEQLRPLVTNPLLLAVVCLVADTEGGGALPGTRVELYHRAIRHLLRRHQEGSTANEREQRHIRRILERAALKLFEDAGGRQLLFEGSALEKKLSAAVWSEEQANPEVWARLPQLDLDRLLDDFVKRSGLLRRDTEDRYYFLHLTFHEYLAACGLAAEPDRAAERLLEYLHNPRWREVVLMTLGQLSQNLDFEQWEDWLVRFLNVLDPLGEPVPRAALLFAEALPEMARIPERAIETAVEILLSTHAACGALPRFAGLRADLGQAMERLARSPGGHMVGRVLLDVLQDKAERPDRKLAAASLVRFLASYTREIAEALERAHEVDAVEWDWPIDAALRDLAARRPDLLPDHHNSLRQELLRNPELARRFVSNPAWLRLGMAVYGGLTVVENDEETTVDYQVRRMHRDSALTPLVLKALKAEDRTAVSLVRELEERCRTAALPERVDAFLALVALGEMQPDDSVFRNLGVQDLTPHLSRVARALDAILPNAAAPILQSLKLLRRCCRLPRWQDLLVATLSLLQRERPIPHGLLLDNLPVDDPLVLAEYWNAVFTNSPENPGRAAEGIIDAEWGPLTINLVPTLAAYAGRAPIRWDRRPGAVFDDLPLLESSPPRDKLIAALEVLDTIPHQFNSVRAFLAIEVMLPTLAHEEAAPEAILFLRNIPLDQRYIEDIRDVLRRSWTPVELASSLLEADPNDHHRLITEVADLYQRFRCPYMHFRCYKRLLQFHPAWRPRLIGRSRKTPGFWGWLVQRLPFRRSCRDVEAEPGPAVRAAEAIRQPEDRARAFTELAALDDNSGAAMWRERAAQAISRVRKNPAGRVIALIRLARVSPPAEQRRLLAEACRFLGTVAERPRAELLALLRKEFALFAEREHWGRMVRELRDPWHRSRAEGLWGPWFLGHEADWNPPEVGALLSLRALLADLESLEHLWPLLATGQRPAVLAALMRRGEEEGLVLTAAAAAVLDDLYQRGERETLRRLLPLMHRPVASALQVLTTWLTGDDAEIRRHAALLLAETEGLSARTVTGVLEWLSQPRDRCAHRAVVALSFGRSGSGPVVNASQLGPEMLLTLARECIRHRREANPQCALQIGWTFERLMHDHPDFIRHCVECLAQAPEDEAADCILGGIIYLHDKTWPVFREALQSQIPAVRRAVMRSLFRLLSQGRVDDDRWEEIVRTLRQFDTASLQEWVFVPNPPGGFHVNPPGALVTAAERALAEHLPPTKRTVRAEELFHQSQRTLADVWSSDDSDLRAGLTMLEQSQHSGWSTKLVQVAARRVEAAPEVFDLLIDWLDEALTGAVRDEPPYVDRMGSLLGVVAAAAEASPERYYKRSNQHRRLPHNLRLAVEQHDTFPGRASALHLLSRLRRVTGDTLPALKAGLRDVEPVQAAAIQSVQHYRDIEPGLGLVDQLCAGLYEHCPVVAYTTVQLLVALARNENLRTEDRRTILEALKKAATDSSPQSARPVHLLNREGDYLRIESRGRLDQIYHHHFIRLSTSTPLRDRV